MPESFSSDSTVKTETDDEEMPSQTDLLRTRGSNVEQQQARLLRLDTNLT